MSDEEDSNDCARNTGAGSTLLIQVNPCLSPVCAFLKLSTSTIVRVHALFTPLERSTRVVWGQLPFTYVTEEHEC